MNKTRGFVLAAGVSLALAFTLSCSSDKDDGAPPVSGGPINLSELPPQDVDLGGIDTSEEIDISFFIGGRDVSVGKITGGKLSFSPINIDSEYLENYRKIAGVYYSWASELPAAIPGRNSCYLNLPYSETKDIKFFYFADSGSSTETSEDPDFEGMTYDLHFSQGLNLVCNDEEAKLLTTDISRCGNLEWSIVCY